MASLVEPSVYVPPTNAGNVYVPPSQVSQAPAWHTTSSPYGAPPPGITPQQQQEYHAWQQQQWQQFQQWQQTQAVEQQQGQFQQWQQQQQQQQMNGGAVSTNTNANSNTGTFSTNSQPQQQQQQQAQQQASKPQKLTSSEPPTKVNTQNPSSTSSNNGCNVFGFMGAVTSNVNTLNSNSMKMLKAFKKLGQNAHSLAGLFGSCSG